MNYHDLADQIIVWTFFAFVLRGVAVALSEIFQSVQRVRTRRARRRLHDRWVAARIAAREETEARLRAEGRWDNYEIQDAMKAAGRRIDPNYRP